MAASYATGDALMVQKPQLTKFEYDFLRVVQQLGVGAYGDAILALLVGEGYLGPSKADVYRKGLDLSRRDYLDKATRADTYARMYFALTTKGKHVLRTERRIHYPPRRYR